MTDVSLPISAPTDSMTVRAVKASLPRRYVAHAIDGIILGLVGQFLSLLTINQPAQGWPALLWGIIGVLIPAIYFIWPYATSGQTLGKRALQIKVVSLDGSPLTLRKGILRTVGYALSAAPLGLGFLWAIWDADKQAAHDKIAGTCVVPVWVAPERLLGTVEASTVYRTRRRWLLGFGIPALMILGLGGVCLLNFVLKSMAEVREMGPWPGPEVAPADLIQVDLSGLGLEAGQIADARDEKTWAGGGYEDGRLITFRSGGQTPLAVWALRYETKQAALKDFDSVQAWALRSCSRSTNARVGYRGVIHCQFTDAYLKTFWNDYWLVHLQACQGSKQSPEVLADQVRDAMAAHWEELAGP